MAGDVASHRFVGRTAELGRLDAAFAHARAGEPHTLCVAGEAGVGKTRLVTRFAGHVDAGGGRMLLGGCIEVGEMALPFAPVAQALRGLRKAMDPAELDELVGPARPLLAHLLPELGQQEETTAARPAVGSWARARLFEGVLDLLERLADRFPTVLVLEDLHWADRSTLDMVAFLVRNLQAGLLLVLTYRSDELHRRHPLRPFLAELDRSGRVDRLDVGRFERTEATELIAAILGTRPGDDLVDRIYRRSEGNAFFTEELVAATRQTEGTAGTLPPTLQNVLLSRIQVLPEESQATLRVIAAGGGRVEHQLLAAVTELSEPELLSALRAAVAHQVLVPDAATETYSLRHALMQEALYTELLPGERARLHGVFARVLAERPDLAHSEGAATPARLAYHWMRAHDAARALPAAVQAGLQSQEACGFADAQRHFELALELWDQVPEAAERVGLDHPALLQHGAETAYLAGDPGRAISLTRAALAEVEPADEPLRAGLLHATLGCHLWASGGDGAFGEYETAVRLVPASTPLAERAQVLAAFGEALGAQGRYRESRELCEEAIAIARQTSALAEEGDARRALGVDVAFLGDLDAGVRHLVEARRIAAAVGKVDEVARSFATLSGLLEAFGKLEAAADVALEGARLAAGQGLGRWHSPFLTAIAARALFCLGRWDDAEGLLEDAADRVAPELAATLVYIHAASSELNLGRGRVALAAEQLAVARTAYAQTVTQPWFATPLFLATAELALVEGRLGDADDVVVEGLRTAGTDLNGCAALSAVGLRAAADRAELARARRDDRELSRARSVGEGLAMQLHLRQSPEVRDGVVPTPRTEGHTALCEAELTRLGGLSDPAHWDMAAKTWERLGEPYRAAYARWREAEAMLLGGLVRSQIEPSLRAADRTARQLGAAPLRAEVRALARRGRLNLGTDASEAEVTRAQPPSPLATLGLTAREEDVLALLALGRTNAQIAQTLFISPKTATVHVSNILGKLGVRNRVEAATVAHRLGIVRAQP